MALQSASLLTFYGPTTGSGYESTYAACRCNYIDNGSILGTSSAGIYLLLSNFGGTFYNILASGSTEEAAYNTASSDFNSGQYIYVSGGQTAYAGGDHAVSLDAGYYELFDSEGMVLVGTSSGVIPSTTTCAVTSTFVTGAGPFEITEINNKILIGTTASVYYDPYESSADVSFVIDTTCQDSVLRLSGAIKTAEAADYLAIYRLSGTNNNNLLRKWYGATAGGSGSFDDTYNLSNGLFSNLTASQLTVRFVADGSTVGGGFQLQYTASSTASAIPDQYKTSDTLWLWSPRDDTGNVVTWLDAEVQASATLVLDGYQLSKFSASIASSTFGDLTLDWGQHGSYYPVYDFQLLNNRRTINFGPVGVGETGSVTTSTYLTSTIQGVSGNNDRTYFAVHDQLVIYPGASQLGTLYSEGKIAKSATSSFGLTVGNNSGPYDYFQNLGSPLLVDPKPWGLSPSGTAGTTPDGNAFSFRSKAAITTNIYGEQSGTLIVNGITASGESGTWNTGSGLGTYNISDAYDSNGIWFGSQQGNNPLTSWNLAEFIGYSVNAGEFPEEREKIEGYLAHKWGLTAKLPANHTYKEYAPVATGASAGEIEFTFEETEITPADGAGTFAVLVSRNAASSLQKAGNLTASFKFVNGTAEYGTHYTCSVPGFDFGSASAYWDEGDSATTTIPDVEILAAAFTDKTEKYFTIELVTSSVDNPFVTASIGSQNIYTVTISNYGLVAMTSASYTTGELSGTIEYGVTRYSGTYGDVSASVVPSNGTALSGSDYTGSAGYFTWATTDTVLTGAFTILENTASSANTYFSASLSEIVNGGTGSISSSIIYITNEDPGELYWDSLTYEFYETQGDGTVQINRRSGTFGAVTASLSYSSSYSGASNLHGPSVVHITSSYTSASFSLTITDDIIDRNDEVVEISIVGVTASLGTPRILESSATSSVTILDVETGSLNFANEYTGTIYITGSTSPSLTYSVIRSIGGDGPATASIVTASSTTTIAGLDYVNIFPKTLNWADQETGSKTFTVEFKPDTSYVGGIFDLEITSSTSASIGTSSLSSGRVVYPGTLNFTVTGSSVTEGAQQIITVSRSLGSYGALTASITSSGDAVIDTNWTATNLTFVSNVATAAFSHGDEYYQFTINTIDDAADTDDLTATFEIGTLEYSLSSSAYYPTATIGTGSSYNLYILDNESGSVNFSNISQSMSQDSSIIITVERSGGGDFAATATIDQVAGTAVQGTDYSGLPTTVSWADQTSGSTTFSLVANNPWGPLTASVVMQFTELVNLTTGTLIPQAELLISNNILTQSINSNNNIDPDFTINYFKKMSDQRKRRTEQLPFAEGIFGPASLRQRDSAYITEVGSGTGSKTS